MWQRWFRNALACGAMMVSVSSPAALNLVLTKGVASAIPFAVVPFTNGTQNIPGQTRLSDVIRNDLSHSGQFRQVDGDFPALASPFTQFNAAAWKKRGVVDVILGQVAAQGNNQYAVTFELVDVSAAAAVSKDQPLPPNAILLKQTLVADQTGLRRLAHQISDAVYQKLTGVRGVFNTQIAYLLISQKPGGAKQYALEVADADGFNPRAILQSSQPIMSPAWAPDGRHIAYVSFENNQAAIYVQDLSTGQRREVSDYPGINGAPAYSPDGSKLALVLTKTGNPKIYVLNLASGQLTQVTQGASIDTEPTWAPDGKSIVFTSNRGGNPQLYRYFFANKQTQRVTFDGNYNARASFLPNGNGLVMMHRQLGMFGIAKQNLTTARVQVLSQSGNDESPSLAPNGKMVLYATEYAGRGVLALVSIDGKVKLRLPARNGSVREPAWSPFI